MKGQLSLLQLLCILFLSRFDTTECRFLDTATSRNLRSATLPEGYLIYPGYGAAYKSYTDKKTWAEARNRCVSDGGRLAIVDTREKLDHIRNIILNQALWVFVGIHKPAGAQEWISVDNGLPVQNITWSAVYRENDIWNCGVVPSFKGGLINWNCAFRENSICEIPIGENKTVDGTELQITQLATTNESDGITLCTTLKSVTYSYGNEVSLPAGTAAENDEGYSNEIYLCTTEASTTTAPLRANTLPEGYSIYPGDNVAYKLYMDRKTWLKARNQCISDGGDLANVATLEKRNRMLNVIPRVRELVWVGILNPPGRQEWISIDTGSPVTSSLPWIWYNDEDDAWVSGAIWPNNGYMTNLNASDTSNLVCEIRIGENKTVD